MSKYAIIFILFFTVALCHNFNIIKLPFGVPVFNHNNKDLCLKARAMCNNINNTRCILFDPNSRKIAIGKPIISDYNCGITKINQILEEYNVLRLDIESSIDLYITSDIIDTIADDCENTRINKTPVLVISIFGFIGSVLKVFVFGLLFILFCNACRNCIDIYNKKTIPVINNHVNVNENYTEPDNDYNSDSD